MAGKGTDELSMDTTTIQFSELINSSTNLERHLCEFILSGGHEITILLSGKTGAGKSHLTNALIGERLAKEGEELDPQTDDVSNIWDVGGCFFLCSGRCCCMDGRVDFEIVSTELTLSQSQFPTISASLYYINFDLIIQAVISRDRKMANKSRLRALSL